MTGDGMCAAFDDPKDAVAAALRFQQALADPRATDGVTLRVRCGLHAGIVERRDNDFFGSVLNRAARIMAAAHGGQVLVSQALAVLLVDRLPAGVTLRDLGAVRLRDLASPERVFQVVHPALRQDFPALRSLVVDAEQPAAAGDLVHRPRARARRSPARRSKKSRLVTLLGAGGLGKTRLSLQAAADVMDDYPDGVWLVELAPLADARARASGGGVGARRQGRSGPIPSWKRLPKAVEDRRLLLILDNCEHLLQACAETSRQLLQAGPQLRILATSREPLHVRGRNRPIRCRRSRFPTAQQLIAPSALTQFRGGASVRRSRDCRAARLPRDRPERGMPSSTSAAASTASRSRSSLPRRACARCRSRASPSVSPTASAC